MYQPIKIGKISTSKTELIDIAKAWVTLSLAFAIIYSGAYLVGGSFGRLLSPSFLIFFLVAFFTAGLGFLLHELSHKFVAQHYGCAAEFRAWDQFLYLALGLAALVGFIFAAPGAVMIHGMITRKENGHISVAGPAMNFLLGLIFLALMYFVPVSFSFGGRVFIEMWAIGFNINMWLGLFNLIPFGPLDGFKVFHWNKAVWGCMIAFGIIFVFIL